MVEVRVCTKWVGKVVADALRRELSLAVVDVDESLAPAHIATADGLGARLEHEADLARCTLWELRDLAEQLLRAYPWPLLVVLRGGDVHLEEMVYGVGRWPLQVCYVDTPEAAALVVGRAARDAARGALPRFSGAYSTAFLRAEEAAREIAAGHLPDRTEPDEVRTEMEALVREMQRTRTRDWRHS